MNTLLLLVLGFGVVAVFASARAELHDEAIRELIYETEREVLKNHLTDVNFEEDYCDSPSVPHGILRQLCKNLLQAYLGNHVTSVAGFKAVLYDFVSANKV